MAFFDTPIIIDINPILFSLGPIDIRWYGLAYVAGLLLGYAYSKRICRTEALWGKTKAYPKDTHMDDFLLWAGIGVIVGGRLGFILFYNFDYYLSDPLAVFKVWEGGMAFHGGLAGVIIAIILFTRRHQLSFLSFCDVMATAAPFGLFFGRIANFINSELWGRVSDVPWAMQFAYTNHLGERLITEPRHPSQLYEAALEGLLLWLVIRYLTHSKMSLTKPGLTAGIFGLGYGLSRILVEFFREPDPQIGFLFGSFLTTGMLLSIPVALGGLALIYVSRKTTKTA